MKAFRNFLPLIFIPIFALSSCLCDTGSGILKSVSTNPGEFNSINVDIPGKIHLSKSDTFSVKIRTDNNLIEMVETKVSRKTLKIKTEKCINKCTSLELWITSPTIENIEASGSVKIESDEELSSNDMNIEVSGSGSIRLNVNANKLNSEISGSGTLFLTGQVSEHNIKIDGSGSLKAFGLRTKTSDADINGSGIAQINVIEDLNINISGSGELIYMGNPKNVKSKNTGSGVIKTK